MLKFKLKGLLEKAIFVSHKELQLIRHFLANLIDKAIEQHMKEMNGRNKIQIKIMSLRHFRPKLLT